MDQVLEVGLPTTPPVQEMVPVNPQMMLRGVTGETRLGAPGASCSRRSGGAVGWVRWMLALKRANHAEYPKRCCSACNGVRGLS
jgi:hypothetical protein